MNRFIRPFLAAAAVALAIPAGAQEAIQLQQTWQVGKRYTQSMKMDQSTNMNVGGKNVSQEMHITATTILSVARHEDGKRKRITIKYDRMAMEGDTNGVKMSADSAKPDDSGPFGKVFPAMVGKEIRAVVDDKNEVEGIEGLDEISAGLGDAAGMAKMFLNEEAVKRMITQSGLQAVPDHPVKPGDSWPFTTTMPMPPMGQLNLKGTYTYKGMAKRGGVPCAEIQIDTSLGGSNSGENAGEGPLAQLGLKLETGSLKGAIFFDNALGTQRESQLVQEINMSMNNPLSQSERLSMPVKQAIHITLDKVEDLP